MIYSYIHSRSVPGRVTTWAFDLQVISAVFRYSVSMVYYLECLCPRYDALQSARFDFWCLLSRESDGIDHDLGGTVALSASLE